MSTKIFDAYECKFKSIEDMHEKLMAIRPKVREVLLDKLHRRLAWDWAHYLDEKTLEKEKIDKRFWDIASDVGDKFAKIRFDGTRNYRYDFYFEIIAMPYDGKVYLKIFCEDSLKGLERLFEEIGNDFYYQNSTDRPKEISKKEWKRREETWDKILEGNGIWNQRGFMYDFSLNRVYDIPFNPKQIDENYFPSREERAIYIAKNEIINENYGEEGTGFQELHRCIDYLESDEGKKELHDRTKKIMKKLIKDIRRFEIEPKGKTIKKTGKKHKKTNRSDT